MEQAAVSDDSKAVGVSNMMWSPLIEPPLKRVCYTPSEDFSHEPFPGKADDLDKPEKNQVDLFIGGVGSVPNAYTEFKIDTDSDTDSDFEMDIDDHYGKITFEVWANLPPEILEDANHRYMEFVKMAVAKASGSQSFEDFQLLRASQVGSGSVVSIYFTFRAKSSLDGKLYFYEAEGCRSYDDYDRPTPEVTTTDTLENVTLIDDPLPASVRI